MTGIVIQPGPDWTTQDYLNAYSNLVATGANPNDAGNTVLAAMIGQGLNPQLSQSALYNVAPFDAGTAIEYGANSVGQNLNAQDASQPWYKKAWFAGGITKTSDGSNDGKLCLDGICFSNPFSSSSVDPSGNESACSSFDFVCKIKQGGINLIALILGFIFIVFGMVMLATGKGIADSAQHVVTKGRDTIETVVEAAA